MFKSILEKVGRFLLTSVIMVILLLLSAVCARVYIYSVYYSKLNTSYVIYSVNSNDKFTLDFTSIGFISIYTVKIPTENGRIDYKDFYVFNNDKIDFNYSDEFKSCSKLLISKESDYVHYVFEVPNGTKVSDNSLIN